MKQTCVGLVLGALASTVVAGAAPEGIEIQTEDVTRFYEVYEAAGGHPTAEQL